MVASAADLSLHATPGPLSVWPIRLQIAAWPISRNRFHMRQPSYPNICRNCNEPFLPDFRNRNRQFFCQKPACRKARKVSSQKKWCAKSPDYWRRPANAERVRSWRQRRREQARGAGQKTTNAATSQTGRDPCELGTPDPLLQVRCDVLQDSIMRNPFILGLLRHTFRAEPQDDMVAIIHYLIRLGHEAQHRMASSAHH